MQSKDAVNETDLTFIGLVRERQYREALELIDQVQDINVVDPMTGATALHYAAHRSATSFIERLAQREDLNYLVQDRQGRYPSELAWDEGHNEALGAMLMHKEKEQADQEGVRIWPKPDSPAP